MADPLDQISAQWTVPTVTTKQFQDEQASTWIGIQEIQGPAFIQVGTTEAAYGPGSSNFSVFWSDTQSQFHPRNLATVEPGDVMAASMVRTPDGWQLRVRNLTEKTTSSTLVPVDAVTPFDVAEYTQEDPGSSVSLGTDFPYPTTSTVTFDELRVNGDIPTLTRADGSVLMSPNGIVLVPTPVSNGGFSLVPPKGQAAQYLRVASRVDLQSDRFGYDLTRWSAIRLGERQSDVETMILDMAASAKAVETLSAVPRSARTDFATQARYLERQYAAWRAQGLEFSDSAYRNITRSPHAASYERDILDIRSSLGLPPP